jgi:hypothetical protein
MINNTVFKEANQAVLDYATQATRKNVDLHTTLFKDWMELNNKLVDMCHVKDMVNMFTSFATPKK